MSAASRIRIRTGCLLVTTPPIIGGIAAAGGVVPVGYPFCPLRRNNLVDILYPLLPALFLAPAANPAHRASVPHGHTALPGPARYVAGSPPNAAFRGGEVFQVGNATLLFNGANDATLTYSVDGVQVSKVITRQPF